MRLPSIAVCTIVASSFQAAVFVSSFAPQARFSVAPAFSRGTRTPIQHHNHAAINASASTSTSISAVILNAAAKKNDGNGNGNGTEGQDWETLQTLFAKHCDKDGLMTKKALEMDIASIKELLELGDMLQEEMDNIWKAAPKFPDVDATATSQQRIDVDSFIQIYRDIDDIFEDDDEEDASPAEVEATATSSSMKDGETAATATSTSTSTEASTKYDAREKEVDLVADSEKENDEEAKDEKQLEQAFATICDDAGLVSKEVLVQWGEIQELLDDNELGMDEFDNMWERTAKSPGSGEKMIDVEGFLSFNVALDDLFEFIDDIDSGIGGDGDGDSDEADDDSSSSSEAQIPMFYGEDLPPGVIFAEIADEKYLVGMDELKKWGDLQDMMQDGDLLPAELQSMYKEVSKAPGTDKLNEEGFEALFDSIESLFEDDEVMEVAPRLTSKIELLTAIEDLGMDEKRLPCGLESTDDEVEVMLEITKKVEQEPTNMILSADDIQESDLAGDWDLLYTTSSTMKFNKSLTGMVPPNAKFDGLMQKFKASKYLADTEYIEKIDAGPASFEVKVTGDWELRSSISLFTGSKSVAINVVPDSVSYLATSVRGDHWKSLGPMNLLDIIYLDDDLRIMRGTTAMDNIFVFKRV